MRFIVALALCGFATPLQAAQSLRDVGRASFSYSYSERKGDQVIASGSGSDIGNFGSTLTAVELVAGPFVPSVTASVTRSTDSDVRSEAMASLTYFYRVEFPDPALTALDTLYNLVQIEGLARISSGGPLVTVTGQSQGLNQTFNPALGGRTQFSLSNASLPTRFEFNILFNLYGHGGLTGHYLNNGVNTAVYDGSLTLISTAVAGPGLRAMTAGSSGIAFIDPIIEITPQFAGSASLVISPGIGNSLTTPVVGGINPLPSVPEPDSWMMLMAGFGLVGAIARRQFRKTTTTI